MASRRETIRSRLRPVISYLVGIDVRALAVFRIGVAVLILTDLAVRATDLSMFYSDDGVLPRSTLLDRTSPWTLSVYVLSGAPTFVALLFAIAAVFAIALLLGYRTRTMAIVSWFLLLSIQNRNPSVNQSGDLLLRLILFWGIFLPLGARYSLDRLRGTAEQPMPGRIVSIASVALMAQIVCMYIFASKLKTGADWKNGSAVYYALQYKLLATSRAEFLLGHTTLLTLVTHSVIWLERFGSVLLFVPMFGGLIRVLGVFAFMSFHLGMSTFLTLGPFMWVPEVALIVFLPSTFWDRVEVLVRQGRTAVVPMVSRSGVASTIGTIVLLPVGALLGGPGGSSTTIREPIVPLEVRDEETGSVDGERDDRVGDRTGSMPPGETSAIDKRDRHAPVERVTSIGRVAALSVLPGLLIVYVLLLNMRTVSNENYGVLPHLQWLGDSVGLNQTWSMFAPRPPHESGWFVIPAHLRNRTTVDLWHGPKPVSWKQPASIVGMSANERWRKYSENLAWSATNQIDFARYQCRNWNTRHTGPTALMRFTMYFMRLDTPPPSQWPRRVVPRRVQLLSWFCFARPRG